MEQPPTPGGAVHRPDGTTNITSLHRTLKKKKVVFVFDNYILTEKTTTPECAYF